MKGILSILMVCAAGIVSAQSHTEKISKEVAFTKSGSNTVMIANINGHIKVEAYAGTKVLVEVAKSVKAKTTERLEKGKQAIQLGMIDLADTIIFYVEGTCSNFSKRGNKGKGDGRWMKGWNYEWSNCNEDCREEFQHQMNFVVKVPASVNVVVSTINEGDVTVENMKGVVMASNINGSIKLTNLMQHAEASTINGDVDVTYAKNPEKDCRFYSLNGDINAIFRKGLSANLSFESFNGDFYTDVEPIVALPVQVEKIAKGDGIQYKVNGNRYKIRNGGALLDFETFNGNVILKENVN